MSEIRLHPTGPQQDARTAALAPVIRRAESEIRVAHAVLAALSAEAAINATAYEPTNGPGEAPRWLLLVSRRGDEPLALAAWGHSLDSYYLDYFLNAATVTWLESLAEHGDDDGYFPLVALSDDVRDMLKSVMEHQAPGGNLPMTRNAHAVAEVWVLDRLSDPLQDVTVAEGGLISATMRRRLEAMLMADDERRATLHPDGTVTPIPVEVGS